MAAGGPRRRAWDHSSPGPSRSRQLTRRARLVLPVPAPAVTWSPDATRSLRRSGAGTVTRGCCRPTPPEPAPWPQIPVWTVWPSRPSAVRHLRQCQCARRSRMWAGASCGRMMRATWIGGGGGGGGGGVGPANRAW